MEYAAKLNTNPMKKLLHIFIPLFLFIIGLWACNSDDDFSSDTDLKLTFSSDTISFDTVFTTIGSSTRQFKIYNKNKKSLNIESIELVNAAKSGFRINIDGQKGTSFSNVDILKKDSLFAFLEVTVDPLNSNNPTLIRDSIRFVTNGNTQYVQLEAIGQDVNKWNVKIIDSDTTLTGEKPFLIYDSIVVKKGVTLRLDKNTRLYFRNKAAFHIYGTLIAQGTVKEPIVMRGDRMDNIQSGIPFDRVSGQWDGVYIYRDSYGNILDNVYIRNGTNGLIFFESSPLNKKATLNSTVVHNTSQNGVVAINCNIDATNCLFTNSKRSALMVAGGKYSFLHCTIANYYFWSSRLQEALSICNYTDLSKSFPLIQCNFTNSIIYGSAIKELIFQKANNTTFDYQFRNCIVKGEEMNDAHFTNIIWNKNPLFRSVNLDRDFSYNFELESGSPAIDTADKTYSLLAPTDLNGNSRLNDNNPDMGCYEWRNK